MKKFNGFTVKGKPFFALGAQVHNSSSYSREMFDESCKSALALNCNTLEAPVYWEKIEPKEDAFNFSMIDYMLELCRANNLRLIVLWFGSWKNGDLSYTPEWVKKDPRRFRRVLRSDGIPVADLSAHYEENMRADAKAFGAVMAYLKEVDGKEQTVIAVQVENEPGYLRTDRDYSPQALDNQKAVVPEQLLNFLESCQYSPAYINWKEKGKKKNSGWADTFGFHGYEYCEAWHLAKYIDYVAGRGKAACDIPMYINVWLSGGAPWSVPGIEYPGGGAVPRTLHVWQAAVENIDIIAPDIYDQNCYRFEKICDTYADGGNALFIPESHNNGTIAYNMFYAISRGAVGVASFGAESVLDGDGNLLDGSLHVAESNLAVLNAMPMVLKYKNTGKMYGVVRHTDELYANFEFEDFLGSVSFAGGEYGFTDYSTKRVKTTPAGRVPRGLIFEEDSRTFYLAGLFNLRLVRKMSPEVTVIANAVPTPDFIAIEEGHFDSEGMFLVDRIRNGDEVFFGGFWVTPQCGIVRIRLV
ncbi:MAG: beta-galactosidase [Treponema sp.]|jgi:hypothetical protein|nr:beta-galactosidase [Treponema sp.]